MIYTDIMPHELTQTELNLLLTCLRGKMRQRERGSFLLRNQNSTKVEITYKGESLLMEAWNCFYKEILECTLSISLTAWGFLSNLMIVML